MIKRVFFLSLFSLLLVGGCGEKKADPAKIDEAIKLIMTNEFDKGIAILDGLGKSSPNDELLKKAMINAHMKYANYFMYESPLPPKEKYPSALKQYRMVTAIDPNNADAKQNISMIEGIYNQMGRTVPQ